MKVKNGKVIMSRKERLRMWVMILKKLQIDSAIPTVRVHGLCNYICRQYPKEFFINGSIWGHDISLITDINFPELYKYKPEEVFLLGYWWFIGLPKPRIETVTKIIEDLKYNYFPEYHDKYIFPSQYSKSIWQYLTKAEKDEVYELFTNTIHYGFWNLKRGIKSIFK